MKHTLPFLCCLLAALGLSLDLKAQPKPSPYPITWELKFDWAKPKRIVINAEGGQQAYWYMTYNVTNLGNQEVTFLPIFQLLTGDGSVIRSDGYRYQKVDGEIQPVLRWVKINDQVKQGPELVPATVIQAIREREKNPHLEAVFQIASTIRLGEDQAREGVAIWPEPDPRMGQFSILVTGLSGESTTLKDLKGETILRDTPDGKKPIVLRKTLKIDYQLLGDGSLGDDAVEYVGHEWIMR